MQGCGKKIKTMPIEIILWFKDYFKEISLKDHIGRVEGHNQDNILKDDSP